MPLTSRNPYSEKIEATFEEHTEKEVEEILSRSHQAFLAWKETTFKERADILRKFADILEKDKERLASIATKEMGRVITAATSEIEKCVTCIRYYADNAEEFLKDENIQTEAKESKVIYQPLGTVLAIMPWNFPFWQVIRFLAPALMAGNAAVLKHASNVLSCAEAIYDGLNQAGLPKGVFEYVKLSGGDVLSLIDDDRIAAVTITGSEKAGISVAERAGKNVKKVVLELGGSDPFVVLPDVDMEKVIREATGARLQNAGQTCIAAKRFFVHESIYEEFVAKLKASFENVTMGDPMDPKTILGPLATKNIRDEIAALVDEAKKDGAAVVTGGQVPEMNGFFYPPTILTNVTPEMRIFKEETFGPVAVVFPFKDFDEAIRMANDSRYGLGASIWTSNMELVEKFIHSVNSGAVFVNTIVKSDSRLPFGGVKKSGYGRELSSFGIKEFTNVKTVVVASS